MFAKAKKFVKEIKGEILEKPIYYTAVDKLLTELQEQFPKNKDKNNYGESARQAAINLLAGLKEAKMKFARDTEQFYFTGMSQIAYNRALRNFAESCNAAIYNNQTNLMAAPGLWNKIKAHINTVLEQYLFIKDFFSTDKTLLATKSTFINDFENAKEELKGPLLKWFINDVENIQEDIKNCFTA